MTWNKITPSGSEAVSGSTEQVRANWSAIATIIGLEHGALSATTSGDHFPGKTGFVGYANYASVTSATAPETGALAYTTDTGELLVYNSSWLPLTTKWARVRATNINIGGTAFPILGSNWTKVSFTAASSELGHYNTLVEYDASNSRITVKVTGYYLITASIQAPYDGLVDDRAVAIYKNGVVSAMYRKRSSYSGLSLRVTDIVYLVSTNYIELYAWHNGTAVKYFTSPEITFQRLS